MEVNSLYVFFIIINKIFLVFRFVNFIWCEKTVIGIIVSHFTVYIFGFFFLSEQIDVGYPPLSPPKIIILHVHRTVVVTHTHTHTQ